MILYLIISFVVPSVAQYTGQGSYSGRDSCVDEVYQKFRTPLLSNYPAYTMFTNSLPTARNLYRVMFLQGFTSPAYYDYCTAYRRARYEFDHCSYTNYKETILSGLGLADFMCIHRVDAFARNIVCLQTAHYTAMQTCSPRCNQMQGTQNAMGYGQNTFGQYPYPFVQNVYGRNMFGQYPYGSSYQNSYQSNWLNYNSATQQMAMDCRYQRCLGECRQPIFEQQCGKEASVLELDALYTTYASIRNMQEPPELRRQDSYENGRHYDNGYQSSSFPAECYALAINSASHLNVFGSITDLVFILFCVSISIRFWQFYV